MTRIRLRRSGGFAGLTREVDTADLAPEAAAEIERLARGVRFDEVAVAKPAGGPDGFQYDLDVGEHHVTVSERAVPDALKPLIDRLAQELRRA